MTHPNGSPVSTYTGFLLVASLITIDIESPYVNGDRMYVVLLICGIWKMISLAAFISVFLDKLQQPHPRIRFSKNALVTVIDGQPVFVFRVASEKEGFLMDCEIKLVVLESYVTKDGWRGRRMVELPLRRDKINVLSLSWQVIHDINESSPLVPYLSLLGVAPAAGCASCPISEEGSADDKAEPRRRAPSQQQSGGPSPPDVSGLEVSVYFKGEDPTHRETIRTWRTYYPDEVLLGGRFEDVVSVPSDNAIGAHQRAMATAPPALPRFVDWWHRLLVCLRRRRGMYFTLDLRKFDCVLPIKIAPRPEAP